MIQGASLEAVRSVSFEGGSRSEREAAERSRPCQSDSPSGKHQSPAGLLFIQEWRRIQGASLEAVRRASFEGASRSERDKLQTRAGLANRSPAGLLFIPELYKYKPCCFSIYFLLFWYLLCCFSIYFFVVLLFICCCFCIYFVVV